MDGPDMSGGTGVIVGVGDGSGVGGGITGSVPVSPLATPASAATQQCPDPAGLVIHHQVSAAFRPSRRTVLASGSVDRVLYPVPGPERQPTSPSDVNVGSGFLEGSMRIVRNMGGSTTFPAPSAAETRTR